MFVLIFRPSSSYIGPALSLSEEDRVSIHFRNVTFDPVSMRRVSLADRYRWPVKSKTNKWRISRARLTGLAPVYYWFLFLGGVFLPWGSELSADAVAARFPAQAMDGCRDTSSGELFKPRGCSVFLFDHVVFLLNCKCLVPTLMQEKQSRQQ